MSRLAWDGTAEPVSRDQILRHVRGQGNIHFPCSANHEQDWQPYYPVDPYSAICDDYTYTPYILRNHIRFSDANGAKKNSFSLLSTPQAGLVTIPVDDAQSAET